MQNLDPALVKHLFTEYVDSKSLVALSMTCKWVNNLISGKSGVCEELMFRISPVLRSSSSSNLHTINFYEEIRRAKKQFMVSCGEDHTIIAVRSDESTENYDRVLTFGSNPSGQLGIGSTTDSEEATEVFIPDVEFQSKRCFVKSVVGGMNHSLILLENGKIYGMGDNSFGQLGPNLPFENILTPTDIGFPLRLSVSMISCAQHYSAIVLNDTQGTVIILGMGLSVDTSKFMETNFRALERGEIRASEKITDASAGYNHLLLITEHGKPYSIGSNRYGQLGVGIHVNKSDVPIPIKFNFHINPVSQVAAGEKHSMILTRDGKLFTFGDGSKGQLGNGLFNKVYLPSEIKLPGHNDGKCFPIIITCGNNHSVVLDIEGKVLTCGSNSFGQASTNSAFFAVNRFGVVNSGVFADWKTVFRRCVHIAAGNTHTAVLGKGTSLFMFGQTDLCGGGGFIRSHTHKSVPVRVDLQGSVETWKQQEQKFFSQRYQRR